MFSSVFFIQLVVAAVVIYFLSGRLIGSNVNLLKRIMAVFISVSFTTLVFWYTYLKNNESNTEALASHVLNVATLLWFGSMLLISMLLYLFFELFDSTGFSEDARLKEQKNIFKRLWLYWRRQKRLRQVLSAAVRNGVTRTVKYVRQREDERELAVALRLTLEQCGGIFIKFGQVLSTRSELFSPIFIDELEKLQQNVPAMTTEQVQQILQQNSKKPVQEVFSYFEEKPLAAASIGQVHRAVLRDTNQQVVVKLLRQDVKEIMRDDLDILVEFASWVSSKSTWAEGLGFRELAISFATALREEIDFVIESRNVTQMMNTMKQMKSPVQVPQVYAKYSNENMLVMDYVDGMSVSVASNVYEKLSLSRQEVAEQLLDAFLNQVLVSGIFHADPHPGNVYINEYTGQLTLLDFGAVGRLAQTQQEGLKLFLVGIHQSNTTLIYDGVMMLVENSEEAERSEVEQAINQVLLKISYVDYTPTDELIYSIFSIVRAFGLHFYPSVSVALRAFVTLDGTLHAIDPTFDIFQQAKRFSSDYMHAALKKPFTEPLKTKEKIEEEIAMMLPAIRKIPRRFDQLVKKLENGKVILHHDIFSDRANSAFVTRLFSQFILLFVGITFGVISVALLAISTFMHSAYAVYLNTAAYLGLFLCAILLVRLSIQAIRNMKKF